MYGKLNSFEVVFFSGRLLCEVAKGDIMGLRDCKSRRAAEKRSDMPELYGKAAALIQLTGNLYLSTVYFHNPLADR